jgi:hypothetical protein
LVCALSVSENTKAPSRSKMLLFIFGKVGLGIFVQVFKELIQSFLYSF